MGYNKFRWWSKGRNKKRLPSNAPLLLKIRNNDYDYSHYFTEADEAQKDADRIYNEVYQKRIAYSNDIRAIEQDASEASKLRRVAKQKLLEAGLEEELKVLANLRIELRNEFGIDVWDECLDKMSGKGTIEDMYWWYKKKAKMGQTPSEMAIKLGRKTTKGLLPNG